MMTAADRERTLNSVWRGQTYDALHHKLGEPAMIMDKPGTSPRLTWIVVYKVVDEKADCIDAFTLVNEINTGRLSVADYFCR